MRKNKKASFPPLKKVAKFMKGITLNDMKNLGASIVMFYSMLSMPFAGLYFYLNGHHTIAAIFMLSSLALSVTVYVLIEETIRLKKRLKEYDIPEKDTSGGTVTPDQLDTLLHPEKI